MSTDLIHLSVNACSERPNLMSVRIVVLVRTITQGADEGHQEDEVAERAARDVLGGACS